MGPHTPTPSWRAEQVRAYWHSAGHPRAWYVVLTVDDGTITATSDDPHFPVPLDRFAPTSAEIAAFSDSLPRTRYGRVTQDGYTMLRTLGIIHPAESAWVRLREALGRAFPGAEIEPHWPA